MVLGEGTVMCGRPEVNSDKLTIGQNIGWAVVFGDPFDDVGLGLRIREAPVRDGDWLLALASERFEDRSAAFLVLESFAFEGLLDCILAKAAQSVLLEVRCRMPVLFVLVATNTAKIGFAKAGSAREEMVELAFIILDGHIILEKGIHRGAPGELGCFC